MKASLSSPTSIELEHFLQTKRILDPSYGERNDTQVDFEKKRSISPASYDYDENKVLLGSGKEVFERARQAIRQWQMFPTAWTQVFPAQVPIEVGQQVAVCFRLLGCWWWNASEIVYTINEAHRFGFAYGTLPGHVEMGEERFMVEIDQQEQVWYSIKAFSRPAYSLVRLAYPFARSQQRRFVRDSMAQMKGFVGR